MKCNIYKHTILLAGMLATAGCSNEVEQTSQLEVVNKAMGKKLIWLHRDYYDYEYRNIIRSNSITNPLGFLRIQQSRKDECGPV